MPSVSGSAFGADVDEILDDDPLAVKLGLSSGGASGRGRGAGGRRRRRRKRRAKKSASSSTRQVREGGTGERMTYILK